MQSKRNIDANSFKLINIQNNAKRHYELIEMKTIYPRTHAIIYEQYDFRIHQIEPINSIRLICAPLRND